MKLKNFHSKIGIELKTLRIKKGLTQVQVARELNITSRAVQYIEAGTNNTTAEILINYSQTLQTKLSDILIRIGY